MFCDVVQKLISSLLNGYLHQLLRKLLRIQALLPSFPCRLALIRRAEYATRQITLIHSSPPLPLFSQHILRLPPFTNLHGLPATLLLVRHREAYRILIRIPIGSLQRSRGLIQVILANDHGVIRYLCHLNLAIGGHPKARHLRPPIRSRVLFLIFVIILHWQPHCLIVYQGAIILILSIIVVIAVAVGISAPAVNIFLVLGSGANLRPILHFGRLFLQLCTGVELGHRWDGLELQHAVSRVQQLLRLLLCCQFSSVLYRSVFQISHSGYDCVIGNEIRSGNAPTGRSVLLVSVILFLSLILGAFQKVLLFFLLCSMLAVFILEGPSIILTNLVVLASLKFPGSTNEFSLPEAFVEGLGWHGIRESSSALFLLDTNRLYFRSIYFLGQVYNGHFLQQYPPLLRLIFHFQIILMPLISLNIVAVT